MKVCFHTCTYKIKSKERNGLQDESLVACLRLSITELEVNFKEFVRSKSLKFHIKLCKSIFIFGNCKYFIVIIAIIFNNTSKCFFFFKFNKSVTFNYTFWEVAARTSIRMRKSGPLLI